MTWESYVTPAILVGLILFVWRDLSGRIDRINERMDRHLEGHP